MKTNFIHDENGLASFDIELCKDIKVNVDFRKNTVRLLYGQIIKEDYECGYFTLSSFSAYIYNLCKKIEN